MKPAIRFVACVLLMIGVSCTRPNPSATCDDGACTDPSFPFCDADGAVSGEAGACVAVECEPESFKSCRGSQALVCNSTGNNYDAIDCPNGCGTDGCLAFCEPDAALSCATNELVTCGANGNTTVKTACPLGCATGEIRCVAFEVSNGLGAALAESADGPEVVLPTGTFIDTDLGLVKDSNGNDIAVKSNVVPQASASAIFVVAGKSLRVEGATVSGSRPLALVSGGEVNIVGRISVRASQYTAGPGAQELPAACAGVSVKQYQAGGGPANVGGSGGGNRSPGGRGGATSQNITAMQTAFSPLAGGCRGASILDVNGTTTISRGGGGGGALQVVARERIVLNADGLIDVGAGGGQTSAGGGSGGTVVLEAPEVTIDGVGAGVVANGGAGGGCLGATGADGPTSTAAAQGPSCMYFYGGNGGTGASVPGNGCTTGVDCANGDTAPKYGGGGGSVGRMRVATKAGGFTTLAPLLSVQVTSATLTTH